MYNIIAKKAYEDGADYYITLNDDAILKTENWTSIMVNSVHNNPLLPEFGTTGFVSSKEGIGDPFAQFNFVSRTHLEIFNQTIYTPAIPNWGIDNWICYIYKPYDSFYLNRDLMMENHVEDGKARYETDKKFNEKLKPELKHSVRLIKRYLDYKEIEYNYHAVDEMLNKK